MAQALEAYRDATGTTWSKHPAVAGALRVVAGAVRGTAADGLYLASLDPASNDYAIEWGCRELPLEPVATGWAGVALRYDATTDTGFLVRWNRSDQLQIVRRQLGVETILAQGAQLGGSTEVIYRAEIAGNLITVGLAGTPFVPIISASISAGGIDPTPPGLGLPFGPFGLMLTNTTINTTGTTGMNFTVDNVQETLLLARIQAFRDLGLRGIVHMTGGLPSLNFLDGVNPPFNLATWKLRMDVYRANPAVAAAVAAAVTDGVLVANCLIVKPHDSSWGPDGSITKAMLDEMAAYAKAIFPTLPQGVASDGRYDWRTGETYSVVDWIHYQYSWDRPTGDTGNCARFRDLCLARAAIDGTKTLFSLNVLDGGVSGATCPLPSTGGGGTIAGLCSMTPTQINDWGLILMQPDGLGRRGLGLTLSDYRTEFFGRPANTTSFAALAAEAARHAPGGLLR